MADPRLTWRNIEAPDFRGVSDMYARAAQGYTEAATTLRDTFKDVHNQQVERRSNEAILNAMRHTESDNWEAALKNGSFTSGVPASLLNSAALQYFGGRRQGLLGEEKTIQAMDFAEQANARAAQAHSLRMSMASSSGSRSGSSSGSSGKAANSDAIKSVEARLRLARAADDQDEIAKLEVEAAGLMGGLKGSAQLDAADIVADGITRRRTDGMNSSLDDLARSVGSEAAFNDGVLALPAKDQDFIRKNDLAGAAWGRANATIPSTWDRTGEDGVRLQLPGPVEVALPTTTDGPATPSPRKMPVELSMGDGTTGAIQAEDPMIGIPGPTTPSPRKMPVELSMGDSTTETIEATNPMMGIPSSSALAPRVTADGAKSASVLSFGSASRPQVSWDQLGLPAENLALDNPFIQARQNQAPFSWGNTTQPQADPLADTATSLGFTPEVLRARADALGINLGAGPLAAPANTNVTLAPATPLNIKEVIRDTEAVNAALSERDRTLIDSDETLAALTTMTDTVDAAGQSNPDAQLLALEQRFAGKDGEFYGKSNPEIVAGLMDVLGIPKGEQDERRAEVADMLSASREFGLQPAQMAAALASSVVYRDNAFIDTAFGKRLGFFDDKWDIENSSAANAARRISSGYEGMKAEHRRFGETSAELTKLGENYRKALGELQIVRGRANARPEDWEDEARKVLDLGKKIRGFDIRRRLGPQDTRMQDDQRLTLADQIRMAGRPASLDQAYGLVPNVVPQARPAQTAVDGTNREDNPAARILALEAQRLQASRGDRNNPSKLRDIREHNQQIDVAVEQERQRQLSETALQFSEPAAVTAAIQSGGESYETLLRVAEQNPAIAQQLVGQVMEMVRQGIRAPEIPVAVLRAAREAG